ncbi:uncharacterized protein [Temnothorax longispinosus]|uniref:uncharacterized protein isoform X3 n=1 Tax=Temnothorax longispinosus TaxID=300112 RepID=UPI003A99BA7D
MEISKADKKAEKSEASEMELKLLEEELTKLNAAGEELYLPYCISKENQEEEKTERLKDVFLKDQEFAGIESSNEIALSKYVMESKEMKNVMKEFEDKLKVMTESYEEKLKEAERKSKEEMEEKLKEMNDLIKSTRAEYDGLVEYGNQTKNFMREKLDEVKMKDTRTSSLPNMPGRSTTELLSSQVGKVRKMYIYEREGVLNMALRYEHYRERLDRSLQRLLRQLRA